MYIEKIKIGNFGKLSNREFELTSGVNILEGRNESGKSTLCEFIKFVFYGLSNKSTGGEMSERKRHISWKTNDASGSIVLNDGGKKYRIERSMIAHGAGYKDDITVVDLESGSVIKGIKSPGEFFFGVPEDVFTRTVYIRQAEGAYFNGGDIGQAVENIFYSADESVNTDKALKKLDEARVMIRHKKNTGRGMLDALEREKDELSERLDEARNVNELIMQSEASLKFTLSAIEKNKKDCNKMSAQMRKTELFGLLEKFDESEKYKKQITYYKNGEKQIQEATTFNGFFPTQDFGSEVEQVKNELVYLKNELDSLSDTSDCGEEAEYSKELAEYIAEQGGKSGISEMLEMLKKKTKRFSVIGLILALAGVSFVGAGLIFAEAIGGMNLVLYGVGVLAIVCAIVCFIISGRAKNNIFRWLDMFEAEDENELLVAVNSIEEAEKYEFQRKELLKYRELQIGEADKKLNSAKKRACELLAKWGISPKDNSFKEVVGCMEDVVSDVKEITDNMSLFRKEIEKNEAVLSVIDDQLSGYNEADLRAEYDSIEFEFDPEALGEIKKRFDFTVKAKESLTEKVNALEKNLAQLRAKTDTPSELESRLNQVIERINELEFKHDAYVLAYEKLQKAGANLRSKLAPGLSSAAGKLMEGLTDGKYKEIGVSEALAMTYTFEEEGAVFTKNIDSVSSGTQDLAYVSLRLALAEMFGKSGKKLPVIFDESFSRLDDIRLKNMLTVADRYADNGSQAVIMTSHNRESKIIEDCPEIGKINLLSL